MYNEEGKRLYNDNNDGNDDDNNDTERSESTGDKDTLT